MSIAGLAIQYRKVHLNYIGHNTVSTPLLLAKKQTIYAPNRLRVGMCCTKTSPVGRSPELSKQGEDCEGSKSRRGLPQEVKKLADSAQRVALPIDVPPGTLCNKELDILAGQLGRSRKTWRRALTLHHWLLSVGHVPDDRFCTTLIRICSNNGQHEQALGIYSWMKTPRARGGGGLRCSVFTYTVAMRAALEGNLLGSAMQIWNDVDEDGIVPDSYLRCAYMEACLKQGRLDEAMAEFRQMKAEMPSGPPVHAYTIAMRVATSAGNPMEAIYIWDELAVRHDMKPSGHAFSAAISACAAACDATRAQMLFDQMLRQEVRPDVVSCTALIAALGSEGRWQQCEHTLAMMRSWNLSPNTRTFTALISAYGKALQWRRAVNLLQSMSAPSWRGPSPNAYTYSAVIKCLGDAGQYELAELIFSDLEAADCPDSAHDLPRWTVPKSASPIQSTVSSKRSSENGTNGQSRATAAENKATPDSLKGLQEGVLNGLKMHKSASFTSLFSGESDAQSAESLQANGQTASESDSDTQPSSWSPLFGAQARSATSRASDSPQASTAPTTAQSSGSGRQDEQQRTVRSADVLPIASPATLAKGPVPPQTAPPPLTPPPLPAAMNRQEFQVTPSPLELFWPRSAYVAQRSDRLERPRADLVVEKLTLSGMSTTPQRRDSCVNDVVVGALMHAYERAGKWRETVAMLGRARLLGIEPNTNMYNIAMSAAGRAREVNVAQVLFDGVAERQRDVVSYETLLAAYGSVGDAKSAEDVFTMMRDKGHQVRDYAYVGLIAAHNAAGNLNDALAVRARMQQDGYAPSVYVMNAFIAACESQGRYDKAIDVFLALKKEGVAPNQYTQQVLSEVFKKQYSNIEAQQATAAALSAAAAAVGTVLLRTGVF